jgi:hypothetical protein
VPRHAPQEARGPAPIGVDFRTDVLPVFTRAGCNTGACHGAALGQKDFKLSLLGSDPRADWEAITRELRGRRVNLALPDDSLVLLKPSERMPHKGGKVLPIGSEGYTIVRKWLEAGAPWRTKARELARIEVADGLRVTAHYSDGTSRDVTRWALYSSNDESVAEVDADGRVTVRGPGETAIVIRYGGHVAVARVVRPFGEAKFEWTRRTAVDEPVERKLRELGVDPGPDCDDAAFLRRASLDILGTLPTSDEVRAFLAKPDRQALVDRLLARPEFASYWAYRLQVRRSKPLYDWLRARVDRPWDETVRAILTSSGREPPTAFFAPDNPGQLAEDAYSSFLGMKIQCAQCHNHPFERFRQDDYYAMAAFFARTRLKDGAVVDVDRGDVRHPRTNAVVAPAFEGGRRALAEWLTSRPQFDRAIANRVWKEMLGRGLVEPVDDHRTSNPATNEPLLAALASEFARNGRSLRHLVRVIAGSEAYRRLRIPRMMDPAVYHDAIVQATGIPESRAIEDPSFAAPHASLAQALQLIAGPTINARLPRMEQYDLEELHLRTLSRPPAEKREFRSREEYEDFVWALLNSKEFVYGR